MKRKKRKFNVLKFLVFVLSIYLIYYLISYMISVKTKNIVILNNNYYNDEIIIETAKIENYPRFLMLSKSKIKKRLLKLDLIEEVKVYKKYGYVLTIDVIEKKILFYNKDKNMYMCSDNNYYTLDSAKGIPTLINYVPEKIEKKFIQKFKELDVDIISKISEIEYSKTSYDEERFLLYMNDGNLVYINVKNLNTLNKYIKIVSSLDNKKGILYLDSGNYFEVKE